MGKNVNIKSQFYTNPEYAPETLTDHPFYGLRLDPEQIIFRDAIWDKETIAVICNARAGAGKSTVSLGVANLLVQYGLYNGIVYIMAPTQEQRQGFLPGGLAEKSAPYMQPLIDAMNTLGIPPYALQCEDNMQAMKSGDAYIQFTVDTYLRGCNFENKVIIIDEAANYHFDELKKTLTRMHDNNKVIIIGHTGQCDLYKHPERSGFIPYINAFQKFIDENPQDKRIKICSLTKNHRGFFSTFCDDVEF